MSEGLMNRRAQRGVPEESNGGGVQRDKEASRARTRLERAELFFGCLVFFAGLFYLTREAKTDAQWYFRVVSFMVGAVGWAVVQFLKRGR
jgi:hypothetical protein